MAFFEDALACSTGFGVQESGGSQVDHDQRGTAEFVHIAEVATGIDLGMNRVRVTGTKGPVVADGQQLAALEDESNVIVSEIFGRISRPLCHDVGIEMLREPERECHGRLLLITAVLTLSLF